MRERIMAAETTTIVEVFAGTFTVTDGTGTNRELDFYVRTCVEAEYTNPVYEDIQAKRVSDLNEQYAEVADRLYDEYHERVTFKRPIPDPFF